MRISDWSSDVCSSDLLRHPRHRQHRRMQGAARELSAGTHEALHAQRPIGWQLLHREQTAEIMRNAVKTAAMHDACAAVTGAVVMKIGRASGRERVCQYV